MYKQLNVLPTQVYALKFHQAETVPQDLFLFYLALLTNTTN